ILFWHPDNNFDDNRTVHLSCLNFRLRKEWSTSVRLTDLERPDPIAATIDTFGNACLVSGEYKARNFSNNFPYTALLISTIKQKGKQIHQAIIREQDNFYTECKVKQDVRSGN